MNGLLRKLRLTDGFTVEFETTIETFVNAFRKNVDPDEFELFEQFSHSKNKYKGDLNGQTFSLKKRKSFLTSGFELGQAKGIIRQQHNTLVIDTTVSSVSAPSVVLFFIVLTLIYCFVIFVSIVSYIQDDVMPDATTILFIVVHGACMFGIPYFILRKTVRTMKYDLERDFYFMIRQEERLRSDKAPDSQKIEE